ncbi:MFS transporter [Methylobacterium sp. EM32]|uniref:MFS transporter n=1 Tax=Methylobacterium sp. EM32 TaxID=3163481 RepID=UPI0033B35A2A
MVPAYSAGARLDRLPISGFHRRILWLIGAGMFFDSFDIYLAGGILGALVKDGWSDLSFNAAFISATFVGMVIGSFSAGILGDRFGRRFTYQANLMIFGLASLAAVLAPDMWTLIVLRFFMGVGLGAEIVIGYATIGEFIPPAQRGRWAAYLSIITNTALFAATLVGYLVIPTFGWRAMFAIAGLGALAVWYARKSMPESPRWLESVGRTEEADRVLTGIEATYGGNLPAPRRDAVVARTDPGLKVLFGRPVIRRTLLATIINVMINVSIYGFVAWVPTFLVKQGLSVGSSLGYTTFMSLGGPVGACLGAVIAERLGRRNGLTVTSLVAALLGVAYTLAPSIEVATAVGFGLFTCIYLMVALGIAAYIPELFPTEYRLRGTGVASTAGRVAGIFIPQVVVWLYASGGVVPVLVMLVGALLLQALCVGLFGIETRNRSLEELRPAGDGPGPDLASAPAER